MTILKRLFIAVCFLAVPSVAFSSGLTEPEDYINFHYNWLDTEHYQVNKLGLKSLMTIEPHQFYYNFEHIFGLSDTLTSFGAGYAYKNGDFWSGLGISSSSNSPFTRLNLIDFDIFFAYKVFQRVMQYDENQPYYMNLYIGIDFSSERIFLEGYPLPVIRYEYNTPQLNMIIGFPLTYIKVKVTENQYLELQYLPVLDAKVAYNIKFAGVQKVSFSVESENKKYRLTSSASDTYFQQQTKYYTEFVSIKVRHEFTIEKILTIGTYAAFIIDGMTYYGKNFNEWSSSKRSGIGYSLGIDFNINLF